MRGGGIAKTESATRIEEYPQPDGTIVKITWQGVQINEGWRNC